MKWSNSRSRGRHTGLSVRATPFLIHPRKAAFLDVVAHHSHRVLGASSTRCRDAAIGIQPLSLDGHLERGDREV